MANSDVFDCTIAFMTTTWTTSVSHVETSELAFASRQLRQMYRDISVTMSNTFLWRVNVARFGPLLLVQGGSDASGLIEGMLSRHALFISRAMSMELSGYSARPVTIEGAKAAFVSPEKRISFRLEPGLRTRNLVLGSGFLEEQWTALTGEPLGPIDFDTELDMNSRCGALVSHISEFLAELTEPNASVLPPALVSSLCESLSRALLFNQPHNRSHILDKPAPPSSRSVVRMVEEYVDAHANEPIVAQDLVRITGASVKSIEAAFRRHRQTTPLAFLQQRRLLRARQALLEDASIPLPQLAHLAGYVRVEPFQAAYFKAFHESPAETRHRGFLGTKSPQRLSPPIGATSPEDRLSLLSERERQVCALIAKGRLNKQIADDLGISERTVKDHRAHAIAKLGVDSTAALVVLWERQFK